VKADALHGGMTQGARTRTLADFKDGYVNVLVATDVAARGIHVDGIDLVLNVDPAGDHKDYLHRAGRTARAGRTGTVVSLSLPHQRRQIFRLMEDAGVDAGRHIIQGAGAFDPEVAEITGARSMTEVQAESAGNAAQQAEREVASLTKQLERAQRRAAELREEADRLVARAARDRGEDPETAVAEAQAEAVAAVEAAEVAVPEQPAAQDVDRTEGAAPYERRERRDNDRGGFRRDERRDDRGGRSFERRDDRGGFNRDNRERGERGFERRDNDRGGFRRDDRPAGRSFERRDERGGHRGSDRPFNRDRRDDRPGFRSGGHERPYGRRDDHRGTGTGTGSGSSFGRRDDKPRWKRNG
jgi:superfamily II DNA/RNA helicase